MALPSGEYIIENVQNRNRAILANDIDGDDVLSGTDADTISGHKWEIRKLHNGTYLIRNVTFPNYASYKLTDGIGDQASVLSIRTGNPNRWYINRTEGFYWYIELHTSLTYTLISIPGISDLDGSRCWTLKFNHPGTPITLEKYTCSDYQHWKIVPEGELHDPQVQFPLSRSSDIPQPGLRQCPPPTLVFTGRRDILLKMHEYFSSNIGKCHIFILIGLGGVGKSQLSLKFIEECQVDAKTSRFSDVFSIDATSADTIKDDLRNIALAKGAGDSAEDGLRWLSRKHDEWLLFFDNADDTRLNLLNYFPRCSNGNIIVTTRNNEARIHAPQSYLTVSGLTRDDAIDLLLEVAGVREHSDETISLAATIVKELGHLALAIIQAGAYICKSGCSLIRYIEMYGERHAELLEEYRDSVQKIDDYAWTVYTTWAVSFEKLSTRAAMFLNVCAFLHHDGISAEIFQKATINMATRMPESHQVSEGLQIARDFLSSFRSAERQWELHKFLTIVMEIRSYSFIDFDERNEMYSIHPLVHAWTRSRVTDATIIRECSQYILSMSTDDEHGSTDIAFRRALLPHVDASLRGNTVKDPEAAAWLWRPYYEGGRWEEAEKLQVLVTETRKRVLGEDHPDTLMSTSDLARTFWNQGRWKDAEELVVRVVEMRKKILGEEHPDTLTSMNTLASTYWSQGRWNDAEELVVRVTELRKKVLGEEHPDTLISMGNLALTYFNQKRWKDAEELELRVVEIRKRVLGEDHPDTILSMGNLASTYWSQGRWNDAEDLDVRVMEKRKRVLGEEHPNTLSTMSNLASTYWSQGRWNDSEELQVRVMEIRKRVLGDEHPDTLSTMSNLASTYWSQGRRKDSEELQVQVMEIRKRVLGDEHPDTLWSIYNRATTHKARGRRVKAKELLVKVVEMSKRVLGDDHPDTLTRVAELESVAEAKVFWGKFVK